ncbi:MAG: rRNA maturation RNase YbeY [Candidatus Omnitrophica bacterium]|nr:rRNA maturation RNase YbeY [Candidatus Omnitrophota bacterium]
MEVDIIDQQKKVSLEISQIKTIVRTILRHLKIHDAQLSFVFVSSQKIRAINKKYLNRSHATDVLAFDFSSASATAGKASAAVTGEIIISTDAVRQNALRFKSTMAAELVLYIVHGLLHLVGYDDHSPRDVNQMRAKEEDVMRALGKKVARAVIS